MPSLEPEVRFAHLQDALGNLPSLRTYIRLCLCFHLDETATSQLEEALACASEKLAEAFPCLTGRVIIEGMKEGCSGMPKIIPYEDTIPLIFNDLTASIAIPPIAELGEDKYPIMTLDPSLIVPSVSREAYPMDPDSVAPVFMIQANFLKGGLLLTFVGNHQIMDATGLGHIIELFAKALRGEHFTAKDKQLVNQPRNTVVPLLGPGYQPGPELQNVTLVRSDFSKQPIPTSPRTWAYFRFSTPNLERLKSDASHQNIVSYVSTDDAIGALCWQAVARARQARLDRETKTQYARVVNVRKHFGLKGYIGHMAHIVLTDEIDVHEHSLSEITGKLRAGLQHDEEIKYRVRALATMCSRLPDRTLLNYFAKLNLQHDLLNSSWTGLRTCEFSYGPLLGVPEASRCPWEITAAPLSLTMPRDKDGSIAVAICLDENEMDRVRKDEVFMGYAEYIG